LLDEETIVAIATANGIGSISIIRVSGKNALPIALKLSKKTDLKPRLATLHLFIIQMMKLLMKHF